MRMLLIPRLVVTAVCSFILVSFPGCKKDQAVAGTIKAAVGNSCTSTINFDGTSVFAYKETSGNFNGMLLVGGYHTGDVKELGFYLPWPAVPGTYSMSGLISGYYDPTNTGVGANEYGTTGSGTVTIVSVSMAADNLTVDHIKVQVSEIMMVHGTDNICVNNGLIEF